MQLVPALAPPDAGHPRSSVETVNRAAAPGVPNGLSPLEEMQKDLDAYVVDYNRRPRGMRDQTPYQVFRECPPKPAKKAVTSTTEKEVKKAA